MSEITSLFDEMMIRMGRNNNEDGVLPSIHTAVWVWRRVPHTKQNFDLTTKFGRVFHNFISFWTILDPNEQKSCRFFFPILV